MGTIDSTDGLNVHETPGSKLPTMIVAFAGWPDAAESATMAVKHLVEKLPARKFADIDPEEFYDFTVVRPHTLTDDEGKRVIRWPSNDFYYHAPEEQSQGLVLFVGTEPNVRWKAFSRVLLNVAEQCGVSFVVSLGALLDEVPHTREPRITGRASTEELSRKTEWLGIPSSGYSGPTGIHGAFMDACVQKGLAHASIWGHSPGYVTTGTNPRVSHALLARLRGLVEIDLGFGELREAGEAFEAKLTEVISKQADMMAYVRRLEQRYDEAQPPSGDIPTPDEMVEELEEFLKTQGQPSSDGDEA